MSRAVVGYNLAERVRMMKGVWIIEESSLNITNREIRSKGTNRTNNDEFYFFAHPHVSRSRCRFGMLSTKKKVNPSERNRAGPPLGPRRVTSTTWRNALLDFLQNGEHLVERRGARGASFSVSQGERQSKQLAHCFYMTS